MSYENFNNSAIGSAPIDDDDDAAMRTAFKERRKRQHGEHRSTPNTQHPVKPHLPPPKRGCHPRKLADSSKSRFASLHGAISFFRSPLKRITTTQTALWR
jgi:hypothetical protein